MTSFIDNIRRYRLPHAQANRKNRALNRPAGVSRAEGNDVPHRALRRMARTAAKVYLNALFESVAVHADQIGLRRPTLAIRSMKRRRATHNRLRHSICLSIELADQPKCCILRIIANELADLAEPQSGAERTKLLRSLLVHAWD